MPPDTVLRDPPASLFASGDLLKNLPRLFLASGVLAAASGCSDEEIPPNPDDLLAEPGNCGAYAHEPCDVTLVDCQTRLAEIAACQWGGPGTEALLPPIAVVSEDEARSRLTELSSDAEEPPTAFDDVFVLLGFTEPGDLSVEAEVNRTVELTAAYYGFEARTITVIDRADDTRGFTDVNATLLHEFVHALQNEEHDLLDLQTQIVPTFDGFTAVENLFEGEASFHETISYLAQEQLPLSSLVFDRLFSFGRAQSEMDIFAQPGAFNTARALMPYVYGPAWAYAVWTTGGSPALQERYDPSRVPESSLDIMRLALGKTNFGRPITDFPMDNVFFLGAPPADDAEVVPIGTDRLGAFTVYVAGRLNGDAILAQDAALAWRGDQLDVFELDAGGSAGRWTLIFESEAHAISFENLISANANVTTRRDGPLLVAVVSQSGDIPEWLFGSLAEL
jgi:hypothetical protein